jgi:hypothetical protein
MNCPGIQSRGYGEINSKTREQQKESAKAQNEFETEEDHLNWDGQNTECASSNTQQQGELCS